MRNLSATAFKPARKATGVKTVSASADNDDEWVKTSICMRRGQRRRLKRWAMDHDTTIQEVIESAVDAWID
ncbi:ATPase for chromosome partitioning [Bifidobacterium saguini DSM 23967]|uniref:ATPase for chromosome partitioning n=2 Tax=Bifidobacterium saguini TaxID=762210 RepID=A0A087D244_9BIFI|nr:hypothetical protein [Bifidobacterium saguini]KFI89594.1 ATPase for chromosome partitioning [Bifidobacterium saguini DSM 23967]QTB92109.1 hypothetical protein BSD967_10465 [Bifidobacterium saguini]